MNCSDCKKYEVCKIADLVRKLITAMLLNFDSSAVHEIWNTITNNCKFQEPKGKRRDK